ncbi:MAG: hypothetical protein Q8O40_05825 [Chloroflexota bacterium]|nr:hypothetical protein [Chloroflexota bacterium]
MVSRLYAATCPLFQQLLLHLLTLPLGLPAGRLERVALYIVGLEACQARVPEAVPRHVALVLLSLVVLQLLKRDPSETAGHVKERLLTPLHRRSPTGCLSNCPGQNCVSPVP